MSDGTVLRIQPGESVEAFTRRIVDTAPPLTPEAATRLRALLPLGRTKTASPAKPVRQGVRPAA
ncbi:hypothetical protein ACF1BS_04555 [Streptomyces sp. NPDC014748]|uniref:hypothetical protein n=1 Tax=Streptomyces sp. NPDC014748 TaxID=3364905 RepID=UPI0036F5548F